jgi:hypothetical protein
MKITLQKKWNLGVSISEGVIEIGLGVAVLRLDWLPKYSWVPEKVRKIVLAGSYLEFVRWAILTDRNPDEFTYVGQPADLLGVQKDRCEVYYVGRYAENQMFDSNEMFRIKLVREVFENAYSS